MSWAQPERRKLARLPLEVFVRIQVCGANAVDFAETRNVSARGLYFHTSAHLEPGQELECVLVLPEKLTQSPAPMLVGCRGKVLRVNPDLPGQKNGVALEIHTYDFSWQGSLSANPDEPVGN
jgi:PilZ domain